MAFKKDAADVDYSAYKKHVNKKVKMLAKALLPFGIEVLPPANWNECNSMTASSLAKGDEIKGEIHQEQVNTFADQIDILCKKKSSKKKRIRGKTVKVYDWEFKTNHVAIAALTQSGKTGLQNLAAYMPLVIFLLTGKMCMLIRFLINDLELERQAKEEGSNFIKLYGKIRFSYNGKEETLATFAEKLKVRCDEPDFPIEGKMLRTSRSSVGEFESLKVKCEEKDIQIILHVDEVHARIDSDSVMAEMMEFFKNHHSTWLDTNVAFIGLSATQFALAAVFKELGYPILTMMPGKNMTNYPWLLGKYVPNLIVPKVLAISQLAKLAGCEDDEIAPLKDTLVLYENKWLKKNKKAKICDYFETLDRFHLGLAKIIRFCLLENPAKGKGMLIRVISNNKKIKEDVIGPLKDILKDAGIEIFSHTADTDDVTLTSAIDKKAGGEENRKPYVVFVTGKGRMGTIAPKDCKYALDFSKKSCLQVILQGGPGRVTGYDKGETWVALSEKNTCILQKYIRDGKYDESPYKPHLGKGRKRNHITVSATQVSDDVLDRIQEQVNAAAEIKVNSEGRFYINRIVNGPVIAMHDLIRVAQAHEDHEEVDYNTPNHGEKYYVGIRSVKPPGNMRSGSDAKDDVNDDNLTEDRTQPIIVLRNDGSILKFRFYLKNELEGEDFLKPNYALCPNHEGDFREAV